MRVSDNKAIAAIIAVWVLCVLLGLAFWAGVGFILVQVVKAIGG